MSNIPPSLPPNSGSPISNTGNQPTGGLPQQLQYLIQELRAEMIANPPDQAQITQTVEQLKSFLDKNYDALLSECSMQGYPFGGAYNPVNELNSAMNLCNTYLQNPSNMTPLFLLNESITQLHFEMTNPWQP